MIAVKNRLISSSGTGSFLKLVHRWSRTTSDRFHLRFVAGTTTLCWLHCGQCFVWSSCICWWRKSRMQWRISRRAFLWVRRLPWRTSKSATQVASFPPLLFVSEIMLCGFCMIHCHAFLPPLPRKKIYHYGSSVAGRCTLEFEWFLSRVKRNRI